MPSPRLAELEAVLAVARHRSFRAAATELGVSPSALSHTIGALERRLEVRLFHRTTRSVALSPVGEQLVARLSPVLRELTTTLDAVEELRDTPRGTLRITASRGGAHYRVGELLARMRERYPDVTVELNTEDRLVDIVADGFDAGIRLAEAVPPDMVAIPFGPKTTRLVVVGSPGYLARHTAPKKPADLERHNCIRRRMGSGAVYRWELEKRGRPMVVDVRGSLVVDDDEVTLQAVLAGAGLAYMGLEAATPHLRAGRLVEVLPDWTPPFPGLRLFHPSGRYVRATLRAFIEVMREHFAKA